MLWLARVVTVLSMLWCDRAGVRGRAWLWPLAFMGKQVRAVARVSGRALIKRTQTPNFSISSYALPNDTRRT